MSRKYNPGWISKDEKHECWFYPSRTGRSIEIYLRGPSSPSMTTTHSVYVSLDKLAKVAKELRKRHA